jgi:NADH-quinone oxidoreductase subunit L
MDRAIPLIPLLPLISALVVPFLKTDRSAGRISTTFTGLSFLLSLGLLLTGSFGDLSMPGPLDLMGDRLGLLLSTYVLLVSLVVHRFSENYMADDPGYRRFFLLLDLMTSVLVLLVLSGNLLLLAVSWSLMGVILYLMLTHNTESEKARRFGSLTLITHLLSDIPLMLGFFLLYKDTGSLNLPEVFSASREVAGTVTLLLVLSAALKSAQFPFHLWIVYSMEGPTPVSALMHAGIVNAGAFLVNRFAPLFVHDVWGLQIAFVVGSLTAVLGSALMLIQNDVKRSLGYSTVGQMGYMIMEIGLGAFALAVYHMMAHGIFKATLFLYSGNVIHSARRDPNIPEDDLYRAVVRSEEVPSRVPWVLYVSVTVLVPLLIVLITHLLVDVNIVRYETALILLFFGWVTGVQVLVSTFRVGRENPLRTALLVILSMAVVMFGYAFLGHSLQVFLYPSKDLTERIYQVAFGSVPFFVAELVLLGLIILAGWVFLYSAVRERYLPFHLTVYTYLSRELYIPDLYDLIRGYFSRLADLVGRATLMSSPLPLYSLFFAGDGILPLLTFMTALFVPLFPLSILTALVLRRTGPLGMVLFTLAGSALLSSGAGDPRLVPLALVTMMVHGVRVFRVRNLRDLAVEIYCGVLPVAWVFPGATSVLLTASGPLALSLAGLEVKRWLGTEEFRFVRGLVRGSPPLGWLLMACTMAGVGIPPLGSFYLRFLPPEGMGLYLYAPLTVGWFLLSSGALLRVSEAVMGRPRRDLIYPKAGLREVLVPTALILISSAGALYVLGVRA